MVHSNASQSARSLRTWLVSLLASIAMIGAPLTTAQAPAAAGGAVEAASPADLESLVGRIALYPDDLVALILPASTNPLQLVQADRFLDKRKTDPKLPIDDRWDDSVKSLVNYPEVIKQMSTDLDWTADLGEAVVADQGAVLDAVQAFRRKAQAAQNLKSDAKQTVVVEKEVIKIVPADPQVIYVPQYNPSSVVVVSSTPVYGYYPAPYPSYYYPYPPGAALATGLIWGAAIGAAWNGGHYGANWGGNNDITINRNTNINTGDINRGNNSGNRPSQQGGGSTAWKSDKKPGQVSSGAGRGSASAGRVGDAGRGSGAAGARPSTQAGGGFGQGGAASARTSAQPGGGMGQGGRTGSAGTTSSSPRGGDAFGGYGSGSGARADSSRGASSRSSMSGGGGSRPSAGGGARGGGGGARGGGGGRGGGGRR